jgi:hypothetical protein
MNPSSKLPILSKYGRDLLSLVIPFAGQGDWVEDHAFAASISPALPADAEEEELAVCSRKLSGLISQKLARLSNVVLTRGGR